MLLGLLLLINSSRKKEETMNGNIIRVGVVPGREAIDEVFVRDYVPVMEHGLSFAKALPLAIVCCRRAADDLEASAIEVIEAETVAAGETHVQAETV